GFVVEDSRGFRYVITAAHCVPPDVPPRDDAQAFDAWQLTCQLLARLGEEPSVWCQCVFLDPVADIAVLSAPSEQAVEDAKVRAPDQKERSKRKPMGQSKTKLSRKRLAKHEKVYEAQIAKHAEAYDALVEDEAITPFTIAEPPSKPIPEEIAKL